MALKLSTVLLNAMLATDSLKGLIDSGKIHIFSGVVPATADEAVGSGTTELVAIDNGGTGITFGGTPANGVLKKTAAETWSGTNSATGTAAFYRLCVGTDDGTAAASTGDYRVQGTIGTDASFDMQLSSVSLTSGNTQAIDNFQLYFAQ